MNSSFATKIAGRSNASSLFTKLEATPKNFVSTEHDLIESVDIDEGEHYLVCFDNCIRKVIALPPDAQVLFKSELNTDVPWLINGLTRRLFSSRKILIIEPFQLKVTAGELGKDLRIQSYMNDKGVMAQQQYPFMPMPEELAEHYMIYEPSLFVNNGHRRYPIERKEDDRCISILKNIDCSVMNWKHGDTIEKRLSRNVLNKIRETNRTPVFTEKTDSSEVFAARVIPPTWTISSSITLLKDLTAKDKILTVDTTLKRTIAELTIDVMISEGHNFLNFKEELNKWLPSHPMINCMEALKTLTASIPDYKPLNEEINNKANQQKMAIISYIEHIEKPLTQMFIEDCYLRFIKAHTPEESLQEAIDYYHSNYTPLTILDLNQFDKDILRPSGIETFLDIYAFFKTPLMNMGVKNKFNHEPRSPGEIEKFETLAELSMDLNYEISKFIEFEIDKDNH